MKKFIFLTVFTAFSVTILYGQFKKHLPGVTQAIAGLQAKNERFHLINLFHSPSNRALAEAGNYLLLRINKDELQKAFTANYQSIDFAIALPGGAFIHLLLTQRKIFKEDFQLTVTDHTGRHKIEHSPGLFYTGVIEGAASASVVACSIYRNEVACVVSDKTGNWNLGLLQETANNTQENESEYAYYNDKTLKLPFKYACNVKEDATPDIMKRPGKNSNANTVDKCVSIFFDCAYDLYVAKGKNVEYVSRYVTSLFNVVATLFYNESITVYLHSIHVWTVPDTFNYTNMNTAWQSFKNYYLDNSYTGDIAQLLSTRGGGGFAFAPSLCEPPSIGVFSFSGAMHGSFNSFPTYSWDAQVITHEDGHVFGSYHTQWCGWPGGPIDNCVAPEGDCAPGPSPVNGGTIMSYCHFTPGGINFSNGFGPLPGNVIREYLASAPCLSSCVCPWVVKVDFPITLNTPNALQFSASGIIYGNNSIGSQASVLFKAGNLITLTPGFYAQAGSNFKAQNAPCASSFLSVPEPDAVVSPSTSAPVHSFEKNFIRVTPNPFSQTFMVELAGNENDNASIQLFDLAGKFLKTSSASFLKEGRRNISVNVFGLPAGVYMLLIQTSKFRKIQKVVKIN